MPCKLSIYGLLYARCIYYLYCIKDESFYMLFNTSSPPPELLMCYTIHVPAYYDIAIQDVVYTYFLHLIVSLRFFDFFCVIKTI